MQYSDYTCGIVEKESVSLLPAEVQVRQFLAQWYTENLEKYSATSPEKVISFDVLAIDPAGTVNWEWNI